MKGDFSRQTYAVGARKHYSAVLMQQGRVQLDADWNEQGAIDRHRTETEAVDVIGGCGAPIHAAGFEITTDGKTLFIGGGRYYVDGLLAENDAGKISYEDQGKLDLPGADMSAVLAQMAQRNLSAARWSTSMSGSATSPRSMTGCCARWRWAVPTPRRVSRRSGR